MLDGAGFVKVENDPSAYSHFGNVVQLSKYISGKPFSVLRFKFTSVASSLGFIP